MEEREGGERDDSQVAGLGNWVDDYAMETQEEEQVWG